MTALPCFASGFICIIAAVAAALLVLLLTLALCRAAGRADEQMGLK